MGLKSWLCGIFCLEFPKSEKIKKKKEKKLRSSYFEAVNGCSEPNNPSLVPLDDYEIINIRAEAIETDPVEEKKGED